MDAFTPPTDCCGLLAFASACRHITDSTAGHEAGWGRIKPDGLAYPNCHMKADSRLSWLMDQLGRHALGMQGGSRRPHLAAALPECVSLASPVLPGYGWLSPMRDRRP
jgi:hypothetical protein